MIVFRLIAAASVSFVSLIPVITVAVAGEAVGYVSELDGSAELSRGDQNKKLLLGETILRGDTITANPPTFLRVDTRSGSIEICGPAADKRNCRWVASGNTLVSPIGDWWNRCLSMISWFKSKPQNLITRSGEPPKMLIGASRPQKLIAGSRELSVAWFHGLQPYRITVIANGRILADMKTREQKTTLPVGLSAGAATLKIEDSEKRISMTSLLIVPDKPAIPDLAASAVNDAHLALLQAGWLAGYEDGAWLLEAYQRLIPIAPRVPAAAAILRGLESGDRP